MGAIGDICVDPDDIGKRHAGLGKAGADGVESTEPPGPRHLWNFVIRRLCRVGRSTAAIARRAGPPRHGYSGQMARESASAPDGGERSSDGFAGSHGAPQRRRCQPAALIVKRRHAKFFRSRIGHFDRSIGRYAARPCPHHHDAARQIDQLVDAVRDEDDRQFLAREQFKKLIVEFVRVISSSAANGSSISKIFGRVTSARAIETRIFMPPDSCRGCELANPDSPTSAKASSTRVARFLLVHAGKQQRQANVVGRRPPRQQRRLLEYKAERRFRRASAL